MATDANLLMGEIVADPSKEEKDVEQLLVGFLHSLIEEQNPPLQQQTGPLLSLKNPATQIFTKSTPPEQI